MVVFTFSRNNLFHVSVCRQARPNLNQTKLKYRFPWQQPTLNSDIQGMLIVINLGEFKS